MKQENDSKNILLVSLSNKWGTSEKRIINDCLMIKKNGSVPYVYCVRDSFIDLKAKEYGILPIYFKGRVNNSFSLIRRFRKITYIIKKFKIDLVHCYQEELIIPSCFYLNKFKTVPLVFSQFSNINSKWIQILPRKILSRLDKIIISQEDFKSSVESYWGIESEKITLLDNYINFESGETRTLDDVCIDSNFYYIATDIESSLESFVELKCVIDSILTINKNESLDKKCKLIICSQWPWEKRFLYSEIVTYLEGQSCSDDIIFFESDLDLSICKYLGHKADLYIESSLTESSGDGVLSAINNEILFATPRSVLSKGLLKDQLTSGVTYRYLDSRELRSKIRLMITDNGLDCSKASTFKSESHVEDLNSLYFGLCLERSDNSLRK